MIDRIAVWALTLKAKLSSERGQDMVEYALITGAIAVGITAVALVFVPAVQDWFTSLGTWFGELEP